MTKVAVSVFSSLTLLCINSALAESPFKVGYVDLSKTVQSTEKGKAAIASLQKEFSAKNTQLEKQRGDLQAELEQFEKKAAIMNDAAKAQKQAELQKRYADLQKTAAESQMDLQKRERELTKPVIDDVRSLIGVMAKEKGFNLVLEENGGGVLYAESGGDLTAEVIEKFNAKNKGKGSSSKKN